MVVSPSEMKRWVRSRGLEEKPRKVGPRGKDRWGMHDKDQKFREEGAYFRKQCRLRKAARLETELGDFVSFICTGRLLGKHKLKQV